MSTVTSVPPGVSPEGKRFELLALSEELRLAHSQILELSTLLKQESEELSKDSRLLRNNGHRLQRAVDAEKMWSEDDD